MRTVRVGAGLLEVFAAGRDAVRVVVDFLVDMGYTLLMSSFFALEGT